MILFCVVLESHATCYMPSFVEIGPLVLEKNTFEGFLPYMGMTAILVSDLGFFYTDSPSLLTLHIKFGFD